MINSTSLNEAH
jgi:hypothetical protein